MAYVEVKLKKAVVVADHLYKPSMTNIIVDEATLAAMGDAVASTTPAPAPLTAVDATPTPQPAAATPAKTATQTAAGHKPVVEAKSTAKKK